MGGPKGIWGGLGGVSRGFRVVKGVLGHLTGLWGGFYGVEEQVWGVQGGSGGTRRGRSWGGSMGLGGDLGGFKGFWGA